MKYILSILMIFGFIFPQSHADHFIYPDKCGFHSPDESEIILENNIEKWLIKNSDYSNRNTLNIPIAFHIIYEDNSSDGGYISQTLINDQVDVLNTAFLNANISFSIDSIEYIQNSNWYNNDDEYDYKPQLAISPETTLNIYTTLAGGYLGYAYLPNTWSEDSDMHGVVVNPYTFPGGDFWPYDEGDTAVHEVGHYLGLLHTFHDGCTGNGDYVSDTPAQNDGDNIYQCSDADTCTSTGNDPIHNYMNYTDDECLTNFTNGQIDRMNYMIDTYKPNLGCSQGYDCEGICGGIAIEDCNGVCNGDATIDDCGVCNGENDCLPIAIDSQYTLDEDNMINIYLSATDSDGDVLTFSIINQPTNGILTLSGITVTYIPNANFNGNDSFTFRANDGQFNSNNAVIALTVNAVNDAPVLASIGDLSFDEDGFTSVNISANDIDGDNLIYTIEGGENITYFTFGSILHFESNIENYNGSESFTITVSDGELSASQSFTVTVNAVNDAPVANTSSADTDEDQEIVITLSGSDIDGDNLTFALESDAVYGSVSINESFATYTPNPNYNGLDSFSYRVSDNELSDVATVTLIVSAVNDAPYLYPIDDFEIDSNTTFTYNLEAVDVDGDNLSFTATTNQNSQISINENTLTITPEDNFSGEIIVVVTVSDDYITDSTQFTLTVLPNNILGDVDQNGNVNVADIVMLVNLILNDIFNESADVDQNGYINVADIVYLISIILNS